MPVDPDQPAERVGYILETAAPVLRVDHVARRVRVPAVPVGARSTTLDLSRFSDAPVSDAERMAPLRAGEYRRT